MAQAALEQARQRYRQVRATGSSLSAQVGAAPAAVRQAQAARDSAQVELRSTREAFERRAGLLASGAVSAEELATARAQWAAAQAGAARADAAVAAAQSSTQSSSGQLAVNRVVTQAGGIEADPDVIAARARLDAARLAMDRTVIRAPMAGIIAQRRVQVGQRLAPGAPIMLIVPIGAVYVDANLKEAQLRDVRVGQSVEMTSDLYGGDVVFHGHVTGIGSGTGAAFSIIPAQNATGNWVKVVQSLPVRVAIDPADLAAHPLRIGLSMEAVIDTGSQ
ncbi:MAG: efflux RND transporter periplasmic adaptor subunit [Sphingopyxis sp.]